VDLQFFLLVDSNYDSDYSVILRDVIQEGEGRVPPTHTTRQESLIHQPTKNDLTQDGTITGL
jgi:hypothetical protein